MRADTERTESESAFYGRRSTARILIGAILLVLGVGWLLDAADILEFPTEAVGPAALVLVGLALIAQARRRNHGGLIVLGIILTIFLTASSTDNARLQDGLGERVETPSTAAELRNEYRLGIGSFTLDLSRISLPAGSTSIEARVGVGELVVFVPREVDLVVDARTGIGEIVVLGRRISAGLGSRVEDFRDEAPAAEVGEFSGEVPREQELRLDLSVGIGPIRVQRGNA